MVKNILKLFSVSLIILPLYTFGMENMNVKNNVYADTLEDSEELNNDELTELTLKTSKGTTIKLYDDYDYDNHDKVNSDDIEPDTQYYTKTDSRKIKIDIEGVEYNYVRLFLDQESHTKGQHIGRIEEIKTGTNNITVRVYKHKVDSYIKYKDDDDVLYEYKIKLKCINTEREEDDYDDIFLKKLTLSKGKFDFSKEVSNYDIYVPLNTKNIKITAEPEDEENEITIDSYIIDEDDDYAKEISLPNEKNTIKVKVEDEDNDEYRVYTINVYVGEYNPYSIIGGSYRNNTRYIPIDTSYLPVNSKWIYYNGSWKYIDNEGNTLVNTWLYDRSSSSYYFLKEDGSRATGWQYIGGEWYYFKNDGVKLTGWQYINSNWYYMYSTGVMARSTIINGYVLDTSGALID